MNAKALCNIYDITEIEPIPSGSLVNIEDEIDSDGILVVEYKQKIYLANPEEIVRVCPY